MSWLTGLLTSKLDLKDLGEAKQFLGLEIVRDWKAGTITLLQRKFLRTLAENYNLSDARPADTPMHANSLETLPSHLTPLSESEVAFMRDKPYRALLGSLNWVGLGTRPEICYALSRLGQVQSNPHPSHWEALLYVLRYLVGTIDMGLVYSRTTASEEPYMYTDSAYADCPFTRKSHSGYVTIAGGAAINWCSQKQSLVTLSSTEAEYVAMSHAAREAVWMTRLLKDLDMKSDAPMKIYADNQSSIILAESERLSKRTKHLDPHYHYVRQTVNLGTVKFSWIPSNMNAADCLTKPLGPTIFKTMPPLLGLPWVNRRFGPVSE
ncbi:hypothetical protein FRC09_008233 [Ceratobasidium sp. 395]|nr:hypothetical protein FRC09_008233 [Ceratobasidium sp. 395]